ncbi:MAG TPA: hypothetical protein ENG42_03110 [Candidatus Aenigmarchaeota archaeon]|nr:hypothetical protein [Candidatus Aenigmarchaeota archaeon]
MKEEFFYEIGEYQGEQVILYYRRDRGVLRLYGMSLYQGDPDDLESLEKTIDSFFRGDEGIRRYVKEHPHESIWPVCENYIAHRLTLDERFKIERR